LQVSSLYVFEIIIKKPKGIYRWIY